MKIFRGKNLLFDLIIFVLACFFIWTAIMFTKKWLSRAVCVSRVPLGKRDMQDGFYYLDNKGDLDKAMGSFNKCLNADNTYDEAYLGRGIVYYKLEKFDQAISNFSQVIRLKQSSGEAHFYRGVTYEVQGLVDSALVEYTAAIEKKNKYPEDHYFLRGMLYSKQGRLSEALNDYAEALREYVVRVYAEDYFLKYRISLPVDFERIINDCNTLLQSNPEDGKVYAVRGGAYLIKKEYDHAPRDFIKLASLDPQSPRAYILLGLTYQEKGLLDESVAAYTKSIELSIDNAIGYVGRARAYFQKQRYGDVFADTNKVFEILRRHQGALPAGYLSGPLSRAVRVLRGNAHFALVKEKEEEDRNKTPKVFTKPQSTPSLNNTKQVPVKP